MAWHVTYGHHLSSFPLYDIENAKYIINFGRNNMEALQVGETRAFVKFLQNGGKYVVVDPRFNTTASKAYKWLPIKPGTDLALALGLIRVVIDEELYDKEFVEKVTSGFDELKEFIKEYSVEWASKESEIPENDIVRIARELASFKPACFVMPPRRNARYGIETQATRAIAILNALMGNYGKKGGFFIPTKRKIKGYPHPRFRKAVRVDGAGMKKAFPLGDKFEGFLNSLPQLTEYGKVKALFVYGTNILANMPQTEKIIKMLKNIPLVVTVETMLTETALYSDVVLPECTYLERDDNFRIGRWPHPFISLVEKAIPPLYDSKPGWWIAKNLGLKLGLEDYFDFKDINEVNKIRLRRSKIKYSKLKRNGFIVFKRFPVYEYDLDMLYFKTPSGKIELFSEEFKENGFPPLPEYKQVPQPPKGKLRLTVGKVSMHTHARTQNNKWLTELYPENMVWINPKDAMKFSIKNGEFVRLSTGSYKTDKAKAYVTERIREGIIFAAHGFGRLSKGFIRTYRKGIYDNLLMDKPAFDPISHAHGYENTFVSIEKA